MTLTTTTTLTIFSCLSFSSGANFGANFKSKKNRSWKKNHLIFWLASPKSFKCENSSPASAQFKLHIFNENFTKSCFCRIYFSDVDAVCLKNFESKKQQQQQLHDWLEFEAKVHQVKLWCRAKKLLLSLFRWWVTSLEGRSRYKLFSWRPSKLPGTVNKAFAQLPPCTAQRYIFCFGLFALSEYTSLLFHIYRFVIIWTLL